MMAPPDVFSRSTRPQASCKILKAVVKQNCHPVVGFSACRTSITGEGQKIDKKERIYLNTASLFANYKIILCCFAFRKSKCLISEQGEHYFMLGFSRTTVLIQLITQHTSTMWPEIYSYLRVSFLGENISSCKTVVFSGPLLHVPMQYGTRGIAELPLSNLKKRYVQD